MTPTEIAAEIYARVITERILGNPSVWEVPEKQARAIADAALAAAQVFSALAWGDQTPRGEGPPHWLAPPPPSVKHE